MVLTWTFRAFDATAAVGLACVTIHGLLFAEVVARACIMDPSHPDHPHPYHRPSSSDASRRDGGVAAANPRAAPVFLVLDTLALALVTLHTLQVCGFAHFSSPLVSHALLAVWPAAIANWVVRLVVETDLFSTVAAAVARKETLAMQHETSLRRLGGARCPPPNAGRARRSWFSLVCLFENIKTMALSGSARIFRRAMLVCSFADWALLLGVWAAISDLQASAAAAAAASAFLIETPAALALPLVAFLTLDAVRLSSQLLHSRLLIDMQSRVGGIRNSGDDDVDDEGGGDGGEGGGSGEGRTASRNATNGDAAFASPLMATSSTSMLSERMLGLSLPAGMTTRLTQYLYALNLGNAAMAAAAVLAFPSSAAIPAAGVHVLVVARFGRLVLECAYLVSTLLAWVDRSKFPKPTYAAPAIEFDASSLDAGGVVRGLSSAIGARLDIAGAQMDEFIAGFTAGNGGGGGGVNGVKGAAAAAAAASSSGSSGGLNGLNPWVNGNVAVVNADGGVELVAGSASGGEGVRGSRAPVTWPGAGAAAMTLLEFTEAISTGLRGHLVGEQAEAAAKKLFREMAPKPSSTAIGLTDIQKWLAAQPPLSQDFAGGMGGSLDEEDEDAGGAPGARAGGGGGFGGGGGGGEGDPSSSASAAAAKKAKNLMKERRWRQSVQRVLRRFVRRAEYGRHQARAFSAFYNITAAEAEVMEASTSQGRFNGGAGMIRGGADSGWQSSAAGAKGLAVAAGAATRGPSVPLKRGLRLLSLEGGGIKGLALIWQLRALERAACRPIHELFDLIGGVSTGGIIALGLSRGVTLAALEEMYYDIGARVFGSQSTMRQLLKGHAADNSAIEELLVKYLGDLPMIGAPGQLVKCFVVTTQQSERLEVRLIRTYQHPNKGRDQNEEWLQWEAGMATSSAPTVFPPFLREKPSDGAQQVFVDGALSGYNNPSSLLLNEGLDLAAKGQQIDVLLSLGCGEVPNGAPGGGGGSPHNGGAGTGLVYWLGQVVNLAFDVQLQEAHVAALIQRFSPQTMHVRLNPPTGAYGLTEHRPEMLAKMEDETRQYLAENRMCFAEVAAALTAHIPNVSAAPSTPWDHPGIDRRNNNNNNGNNGGGGGMGSVNNSGNGVTNGSVPSGVTFPYFPMFPKTVGLAQKDGGGGGGRAVDRPVGARASPGAGYGWGSDPFAAAADAATAVSNTLNHAWTDRSVTVKSWFDSEADVMFSWDDERDETNADADADADADAGKETQRLRLLDDEKAR